MLFSINFNYCPFKVAMKTNLHQRLWGFIATIYYYFILFNSIQFNQHAKNKGEKKKRKEQQ